MKKDYKKWMENKAEINNEKVRPYKIGDIAEEEFSKIKEALVALLL